MRTNHLLGILMLSLFTFIFISCDKEEEGFSKEEIQQVLFELKGTYNGTVHVSGPNGLDLTLQNAIAVSRDSLKFKMSLQPYIELISDKILSDRLHETGEVEVIAGYHFNQWDDNTINFSLNPKDVNILGGFGAPPAVRLVFSKNYGGDAIVNTNFIMFNISPTELWVDGEKYEDFPSIVYHFEGVYE